MVPLLLVACSSPSVEEETDPPATDDTDDTDVTDDTDSTVSPGLAGLDDLGVRNLVIIHTDTLRADRLPPYGGVHDTLPLTNARDWLVVSQNTSVGAWTFPATASMLTSLEIQHHGLTRVTAEYVPNADLTGFTTLAEHLRDQGFKTYFGSGNLALQSVVGIDDGFDASSASEDTGFAPAGLSDIQRSAFSWLDTQPEGTPFFLFFQPMDVHGPYLPHDKLGTWSDVDNLPISVDVGITEDEQDTQFRQAYAEAETDEERAALVDGIRNIYDETILNLDDGIEAVFASLAERGLDQDTLVVLTADHGETLADDPRNASFLGHGGTVRAELTHVPLMFNAADLPDQDIDCLTQNIDVVPTVLQALGLPPMTGVDGQVLQDGCRTYAHASTYRTNSDTNRVVDLMVTDGVGVLRWLCLEGIGIRYDLSSDPGGRIEIARDDTPNIEGLEAEMSSFYGDVVAGLGVDACVPME